MSDKEWLSNFNYIAIINLLKAAISTLEKGQINYVGSGRMNWEKNEVKNIVDKLTKQLNLLIEEEKDSN